MPTPDGPASTVQTPVAWRALAAAFTAVVLWGTLPVLRGLAPGVPALQLTALALAFAAVTESVRVAAGPWPVASVRAPSWPWLLGLAAALVGAVAFYFAGLALAPPARVTLITYTWPLLFVVAGEWRAGGRLTRRILAGALTAFAGAALLVLDSRGAAFAGAPAGYALGLLAGVCWTGYSLGLQHGRTAAPAFFPRLFMAGGALAALLHLAVEPTAWPLAPDAWAAAAVIGVGPYGLAFVAWGHGVRHGPARTVGAMSYAVPVVATTLLVGLGMADPGWRLAAGTLLVVGGIALTGRR